MFFLIMMGCSHKIKPEEGNGGSPRVCPRCRNVSVIAAKKTTWFELFWIPIVPFSFKHIWVCPVCNWSHPKKDGQWEPAQANGVMGGVLHANAPPNIPGYQPSYIAPAMKQ